MKSGVLHLLLCTTLLLAALPAAPAGPPTALFRDDFDDTTQLETRDNLVAQDGYLQVPAEVTWLQDTAADLDPGTGHGVDLSAQPGHVVLARFTPDRRVNDVAAGFQGQVAAAYSLYAEGQEDVPYLYAAWADGRGADLDIYFARSTDAGHTWTAGRQLNLLAPAGDQRAPAIAASGGYVHVAWEDDAGVHYARSLDYGATWVNDVLLAAGGRTPTIAAAVVDTQPLVYLVYSAADNPADPDLYARRSANGGLTWEPPEDVVAAEPVGAAQRAPRLWLPGDSDLPAVAWEDDRDGDWDVYAGRRSGGGWSNQRVARGPAGSLQSTPVLFRPVASTTLHALWVDDRAGASALYEAQYDTDTLEWVELGPVPGGAGAGRPAVATLAPTWAAWPAGATVLAGRHNGTGWAPPVAVADHRPGVVRGAPAAARADLAGQTVAVLWSDDRADAGDIYVATSAGSYQATGCYTSTVHDWGELAAWGPITWTGSSLDSLALVVRSGATPEPGPDWSDWTPAGNGAVVPVPPARYLQYRVHLTRTTMLDTPALDRLLVRAAPRGGTAGTVPIGQCVAAWGEFASDGYAPTGTTMTLSVLDLTGTVLYSDVVTPFDLGGLPAAEHGRLRLQVALDRTPTATPMLNWWQVTWTAGRTQAAFSYEPPVVYTPTVVVFTNRTTATVAPVTYTWTWGDHAPPFTGGGGEITHTYAAPGTYTVTLRAEGECGPDVATGTVTVLPVPLVPPVAAFSHGPLCVGTPLSFTNASGDAIWWQWTWGDGTGSAAYQPTHVYSASGDYTVTLAVTNTRGSDQAAALLPVRPPPTAAFSWTAALLTVALTPTVSGDPALRWAFGDGYTSTLAQPVHRYAATGDYTVTLTATNGCHQTATAQVVRVACAPAAAQGFTWTPPVPAPGAVVAFTAAVTGSAPLTLTWSWGDGAGGVGPTATHSYAAAGAYTVTLRAANACGEGTAAAVVTVAAPVYRAQLPLIYTGNYYAGDAYEDDDTREQARLLPLDTPQRRDFAPAGDEDWVYLHLTDGVNYYFYTYDLAGGADTVLTLYAAGQAEPLRENDDCTGQTLASCLTFMPLTAGRYELRVTNISGQWGPAVAYTLAARLE